jgi:hypothetical protein
MSDAYANLKRLREKAIAALDAAIEATQRATEIGERFRQMALWTLPAAILERVSAVKPRHRRSPQGPRGSLQRVRGRRR